MKKILKIDARAERELREFSENVQLEFEGYFDTLRVEGRLEFPEAKKFDRDLFEIRIKLEGAYRGFYAYIGKEVIVILHFFRKKSQKAPLKNVKIAKRRLREYGL